MPREKLIHEIEVHVACVCIAEEHGNIKILIGKRAYNREIFPSYWECGGGQIHANETFEDAVKSHMHDEFGIVVDVLFPYVSYIIDLPNKKIPGVRFLCKPQATREITIDNEEIIEFKWVYVEELNQYRLIPGLLNDILTGCKFYEKLVRAQQ